jgi:predicted adenylyl cyclase CyaB
MANELEVKILEVDVEDVVARLLALGAQKHFEGEVEASLFKLKKPKNDGMLGLYKKEDGACLVYTAGDMQLSVNINKHDEMIRILDALGYPMTETPSARFFEPKHRKLAKDELVRLRRIGDTTELTYKRRIYGDEDIKSNLELEVVPDDYNAMLAILTEVGFKEHHRINKHRVSYIIPRPAGDEKYEFDTLSYPVVAPTYLELEASTGDELRARVAKLGFTMKQTTTWPQMKVVKYYAKRQQSQ